MRAEREGVWSLYSSTTPAARECGTSHCPEIIDVEYHRNDQTLSEEAASGRDRGRSLHSTGRSGSYLKDERDYGQDDEDDYEPLRYLHTYACDTLSTDDPSDDRQYEEHDGVLEELAREQLHWYRTER